MHSLWPATHDPIPWRWSPSASKMLPPKNAHIDVERWPVEEQRVLGCQPRHCILHKCTARLVSVSSNQFGNVCVTTVVRRQSSLWRHASWWRQTGSRSVWIQARCLDSHSHQPVRAADCLVSRWLHMRRPCCATKSSTERAFLPSFRARSSAFLCSSGDGSGVAATHPPSRCSGAIGRPLTVVSRRSRNH